MNSLFEGQKVPTSFDSAAQPEQAKEVTLDTLLKGMTETELDFLRSCLVIDGTKRKSVIELLEHPYFDKQFKQDFEEAFPALLNSDLEHSNELTRIPHLTKDGRDELPLYEILTDSEIEEDDSEGEENSSGEGDQQSGESAGMFR